MLDDPGQQALAANSLERITLSHAAPEQILPRPWAYGRFLMFGAAAMLGAVDGGGKGAIVVSMALSMITGTPLLGEKVWRTGPVAIISYEDDEGEWHRRIAAACLHHGVDYRIAIENIHFLRKPGGRVTFGGQSDGLFVSDAADIIEQLRDINAALLIIDPFNHAHDLDDGNNNATIAKVAGEISRVARESYASVLVLHHLRKGASGSPDDLMGATSLRATFRSCRVLARMTDGEAAKLQINDPWRYIRIAGSKENYAPPAEKGTWFRLTGIELGNATNEYPDGDEIAVATTWEGQPTAKGMDVDKLQAVFQAFRDAVHSPVAQAKKLPWAGQPLMDKGGLIKEVATKKVRSWIEEGVLVKGDYYEPTSRNTIRKVILDEEKAIEILASLALEDASQV